MKMAGHNRQPNISRPQARFSRRQTAVALAWTKAIERPNFPDRK